MADLTKPIKKNLVLVTVAVEVEHPSQITARLDAADYILKTLDLEGFPTGMKLIPGLCHSTVEER